MEIHQGLLAFSLKHSMIKVHNRVGTKFWKDKWIGTRSLQELFPDAFDLAQDQHNTVAKMLTQQGWNMRFRIGMNDWERSQEWLNYSNN